MSQTHLSVALRFYTCLAPELITKALGIEPSLVRKEEITLGAYKMSGYVWSRDCKVSAGMSLDRVAFLALIELDRKKRQLRQVEKGKYRIMLWCAVFGENPEKTIYFSPLTMGMASKLAVEVYISVYYSEN